MVKKETKKEYAETQAEITERLARSRNMISVKKNRDRHAGGGEKW